MANNLQPMDVYELFNEVVAQATGRNDLRAVDASSFASVGETVLRTGAENTLNAISNVIGKTIFSVRPYKAKLQTLYVDTMRWGGQVRKIVTLYDGAEESEDFNTDVADHIKNGDTVDMYKIRQPRAVQLNFYGTKKLQKHITRYRDQLSLAFHSEDEFIRFIDAIMIEFFNEVELMNEQKARLTLNSLIAGKIATSATLGENEKDWYGNGVVDLVKKYNVEYGTTYTRAELLSTHIESFMKYVAAEIKIYSAKMSDMSTNFHTTISNTRPIMRHTPKEKQKMVMYEPVFIKSESTVYSSLFNPNYLNIGHFEGVNFWQAQSNPTALNMTPNVLNPDTGASEQGAPVNVPYVLGVLFDEEACGVVPQFDYTSVTPFNSAGGYYNIYMHWRFNSYVDYTENAVVFVLGVNE